MTPLVQQHWPACVASLHSSTWWRMHEAEQAPLLSPVPAELTLWTATWLQAPGAAPQSTTQYPGCSSLNLSSISSSLKALLHLKFCAWEALTYGSLSCRCSHRCSAAVLAFSFFIKPSEEWKHLLWKEKVHIDWFSGQWNNPKGTHLHMRRNTTPPHCNCYLVPLIRKHVDVNGSYQGPRRLHIIFFYINTQHLFTGKQFLQHPVSFKFFFMTISEPV